MWKLIKGERTLLMGTSRNLVLRAANLGQVSKCLSIFLRDVAACGGSRFTLKENRHEKAMALPKTPSIIYYCNPQEQI